MCYPAAMPGKNIRVATLIFIFGALSILLGPQSALPFGSWSDGVGELVAIPEPETENLPPELVKMAELLQATIERPQTPRLEVAESFGELGRLYHVSGHAAAAEACYQNARRLAPQDHRWPYYLGYLQQGQGRFDAALASYVNAVAIRSTGISMVRMAHVLIAQRQLDAAVAVLGNALRINPTSAPALTALAEIEYLFGSYQEALDHFKLALTHAPDATALHRRMADIYHRLGNESSAAEHESLAGSNGPPILDRLIAELVQLQDRSSWQLKVGQQAIRAGRFSDAVTAYRAAVEANPQSREAQLGLGQALELLGDRRAALNEYTKALQQAPDDSRVTYYLGRLLVAEGAVSVGLEYLTTAVALAPEYHPAVLELARTLAADQQLEASLNHFAAAARLAPDDEQAWLGGSSALLELGRYAQAQAVLSQAHERLPNHFGIATSLARLLAASPDPEVRDGKRALRLGLGNFEMAPTADHAETVAMALTELGCCIESATWLQTAIAAASKAGDNLNAKRLEEALPECEQEQPCPFLDGLRQ
jgi:tetratricopeptide (TPR) repeat protein